MKGVTGAEMIAMRAMIDMTEERIDQDTLEGLVIAGRSIPRPCADPERCWDKTPHAHYFITDAGLLAYKCGRLAGVQ